MVADIKSTVTPAKVGVSGSGALRWRNGARRLHLHHDQQATGRYLCRCHSRHRSARRTTSKRHWFGFCKKYGLTRLVLIEPHDDITLAITREKALKAWKREWKIRLVDESNPGWRDISHLIL